MQGYYLKHNKCAMLPRVICFLDTETRPKPIDADQNRVAHSFRLGVAVSGRYENGKLTRRKRLNFSSPQQFWEWFLPQTGPRHTTWLVAHNLLFDLIPLDFVQMFEEGKLQLDKPRSKRAKTEEEKKKPPHFKLCVLEDPPTIIGLSSPENRGRFVCVDSFNWFKQSIKQLGENIGCPKLDMPSFFRANHVWFRYCSRDVEILEKTFIRYLNFLEEHDLGNCKWTAAGQAYAAFRHRFMKHKILLHDNLPLKEFERFSYFGGRWECWRLGKILGGVWHLDVNSLFPSVMKSNLFPVKPTHWKLNRSWSGDFTAFIPEATIAHCEIFTDKAIYPARRDNEVIYPIGKFTTVLAGPELAYAIKAGHCRRVSQFCQYEMQPIFDAYVKYFWNLRKHYDRKSNQVYSDLCKLFLNSLYGKFGQRVNRWVDVPNEMAPACFSKWRVGSTVTDEVEEYRSVGYDVQKKCDGGERQDTFPAISSFVTSYARIRMNELRETAGIANVFYQGIDCLITNNDGYGNLTFAGEVNRQHIGKMKIEAAAESCFIAGLGRYQLGNKKANVGIKQNAVEQADGSFDERIFRTGENLFTLPGLNYIVEETVSKKLNPSYSKGVVDDSGRVWPFKLD